MAVPTHQLLLAYRQAKIALTEERMSVGLDQLARFETRLNDHLSRLSKVLSPGGGFEHTTIGEVWLSPKKVALSVESSSPEVVRIATPLLTPQASRVEARYHLQPSVEFAVAETLWICRYGAALDALLAPECLANRVKLDFKKNVDRWTRRIFQFWKQRYRKYQDGGIEAAKELLQARGRCAFATFDMRAYYDNIAPDFLTEQNFVRAIMLRTPTFDAASYLRDTRALLKKYAEYRTEVARLARVEMGERGIPIGALTSRLVANLALLEVDARMRRNRGVYYYSRWVDDVIVVTEGHEAQGGLRSLIEELLPTIPTSTDLPLLLDSVALQRPKSYFEVHPTKGRVYLLEGLAGLDFLGVIRNDLDQIVSEQNAFASVDSDENSGTDKLLALAGSRGADGPEAFQGIDELRIRRFATSVLITKATESISLLSPDEALTNEPLRKLVRVLARESEWTNFLDMLLRILGVAVAAANLVLARESIELLDRWAWSIEEYQGRPTWRGISLPSTMLERLSRFLSARTVETIAQALPDPGGSGASVSAELFQGGLRIGSKRTSFDNLLKMATRLHRSDLRLLDQETEANRGTFPAQWPPMRELRTQLSADPTTEYQLSQIETFVRASNSIGERTYGDASTLGVFLMVRPPSIFDIHWRWSRAFPTSPVPPIQLINAIRGTNYGAEVASWSETPDGSVYRMPPSPSSNPGEEPGLADPIRLVLGNLTTDLTHFAAAANGQPITTKARLKSLRTVVNAARSLRRPRQKLLLLLPELSLPRTWLRRLVRGLTSQGIALVAGLEYDRVGSCVANEVVAALPGPYSRVGYILWRKSTPAVGDEAEFLLRNNLSFPPALHLPGDRIVTSDWGAFSVLICSELLEVSARARLPGRVDYVLVPCWNQDRFTFEYLAQASVLDLHAYVAIANNATYSDCRIRGPYREDYRRDVCRLIDRNVNSVISGVPEIDALRDFQLGRQANQTTPVFKPLPPGFRYRRP